jgi:hypothetical protein
MDTYSHAEIGHRTRAGPSTVTFGPTLPMLSLDLPCV